MHRSAIRISVICGVLLVLLAGIFLLSAYIFMGDESPQPISTELESRSTTDGYTFQYPVIADTPYIDMTDWPPSLRVHTERLGCTEAGTPESRAGQTLQKTIDGRTFCVTEMREGAAGSVYHQYAYATEHTAGTFVYTFTVRMPQCGNYDAAAQEQCLQVQNVFDPDAIANTLVETTRP